jgi:hypothetical protein
MGKKSGDPVGPVCVCSDWRQIVECFDLFPHPQKSIDSEGDVTGDEWVFRGLQSWRYELETTIER